MFLVVFKEVGKDNWLLFEISDRKNDIIELRKFLLSGIKLIGFNNINFDYPVLHRTILSDNNEWSALDIYTVGMEIINTKYSSIWDNQVIIPQLDLYKIWHYDNKNKATSLKWLEFAMRMKNIEDLPFKVGTILNEEQMQVIVDYCYNDIEATEQFFFKSLKHIKIRQFYTDLEKINLINASETKIAKEIFAKHISKQLGIKSWDLKKKKTFRSKVNIKNVILPYIKFKHKQNIELLEQFSNAIWVDKSKMSKAEKEKHTITFEKEYLNIHRVCGEGGIHSFSKPGIYESNDEYMVYDLDFASYYPHLSFKNQFHPKHIPEKIFSKIYEGFYKERKTYSKKDPRNYVLKIVLNAAYGLSKDIYSFLYDPMWQLQIVINGQLLLCMLTEWVIEATSYCKIIFENTDGAAFVIKRSEKHLVDEVCKKMEQLSGIALEAQECQKLIMRDVNNYINIIDEKNIKFKGAYEIDRDYHKNHSKRIVSIAVADYFINGVPIEHSIYNHLNNKNSKILKEWDYENDKPIYYENYGIYDYCLGNKSKGGNKLYERVIKGKNIIDTELGKVNRYYVSNEGSQLIKKLPPLEKDYLTETEKHNLKHGGNQINIFDFVEDVKVDPTDRESNIEAGFKCTLFNKFKKQKEYDLNYSYYLEEANKLIKNIIDV